MKKTWLMCLMTLVILSLQAQEEDKTTFTDAELVSYATVMVWVEGEKEKMGDAYNGWIQANDSIEASKFSELLQAKRDDSLDEVEATENELAAFNSIEAKNEKQQADFKEEFVSKLREEVTISLYNDLRKALKKDDELSARYDQIFDELLTAATESVEPSDDPEAVEGS